MASNVPHNQRGHSSTAEASSGTRVDSPTRLTKTIPSLRLSQIGGSPVRGRKRSHSEATTDSPPSVPKGYDEATTAPAGTHSHHMKSEETRTQTAGYRGIPDTPASVITPSFLSPPQELQHQEAIMYRRSIERLAKRLKTKYRDWQDAHRKLKEAVKESRHIEDVMIRAYVSESRG